MSVFAEAIEHQDRIRHRQVLRSIAEHIRQDGHRLADFREWTVHEALRSFDRCAGVSVMWGCYSSHDLEQQIG